MDADIGYEHKCMHMRNRV
ncbi:Os09g0347401 [Oryza sativa Japonica Group]|uniref:Os09g0347401 protein n=1 Tax=Oryza sativa subsp. japonica TaxID=39947 RepID=A0A0P0XLS6_ORYSJ|nr:hypothetical protein EE612_047165 [Oryza sativa]BAT07617.1 Os09g0347401 [Oryza sativa Japonica Group]